ncbi:ead/Ea22-like family protein [Escherichia coli]|nr:ead/Ea22-like family protein [Escherichia coli]EEC8459440.1 ead/Ea22-like family protein [Escherichia coli]EED0879526.1 ead/Ea22-like family protein [Escherichia coli]EED0992776.1 ead/Ea22-like family protein [Escherichia coli]EED1826612.1 ead/Ea22-like family protein [Escherichia coli]EEQ4082403.1 ead/Ea22-like family protein [Escherichia coli]
MREVNYEALREAAEKATKGCYIVGHTSGNQHGNITGVFVCQKWKGEPGGVIAECHVNCLIESDAQAYANAEFIAEANPATVLELLDELEAQSKRIAELETNLAALAAENAGLNKFIVQSCYVFDGEQDELSDAYICAIDGRMPQIPATDAFLADVRAGAFNDLCAAFVRHAKIAGLDDGDLVTVKEATDALLHCAEQLREGFKQ